MADMQLGMWRTSAFGKAIERHLRNGFAIFPLHGINEVETVNGAEYHCTCGTYPCGAGNKNAGKHPFTAHGFKDCILAGPNIDYEMERAAELWEYREDLNVGIATGLMSKIVIIDIDNKNENAGEKSITKLEQALGMLPRTVTFTTGNGEHRVFSYPKGGLSNSNIAFKELYPGIDIRGDGGYVVAFPSRHFTGRYYKGDETGHTAIEELPSHWLNFIRHNRNKKEKELLTPNQISAPEGDWSESDVREMLSHVSASCQYPEWINIGMAIHDGGYSWRIFDDWSSSSGDKYLGKGDVLKHWNTFKKGGGRGFGTVVQLATLNGWKPQPKFDERVISAEAEKMTAAIVEKVAKKVEKREVKIEKIAIVEPEKPIVTSPITYRGATIIKDLAPLLKKEERPWFTPELSFDPMELVGPIGDTIRWIDKFAIQHQPELDLMNVLAWAGTVFGRRYATPLDTRSNVYFVGIAGTGFGKDHSRKMIQKLAAASGLIQFLGGNRVRSDTGMLRELTSHACRLLQIDEFGTFLQSITQPKSAHHVAAIGDAFTQLYSAANGIYDHGKYADPKADNILLTHPHLCIYGTTTERRYVKALTRDAIESGDLNRFVVLTSRYLPDARKGVPIYEEDQDVITWWKQFAPNVNSSLGEICNSATIAPRATIVEWGECEYIVDALAEEQKSKRQEKKISAELWSRFRENTLKIAMIFAIARDPKTPKFRESDFEYARSIVVSALNYMTILVQDCIAESPQEQMHKDIFEVIQRAGAEGITRSGLLRSLRKYKKNEIDNTIATLHEEEIMLVERDNSNPGRPKYTYFSTDHYAPDRKTA